MKLNELSQLLYNKAIEAGTNYDTALKNFHNARALELWLEGYFDDSVLVRDDLTYKSKRIAEIKQELEKLGYTVDTE